jgi:hypothetical protein
MKVLKPGREQRGWSKECVCTGDGNGGGGCGATLLVEQSDVYRTHRYDYGGGHDTFNTFTCGACGVATDMPESVSLPFTPPDWKPAALPAEPGQPGNREQPTKENADE